MASQINASNSGFGGIVSTGDSSGVLQLQAAGTTIATIQSTGLNLGSNGVVFSDASTQTAAASPYVLKNRIINGDMRIDQRNAGASVTASTTGAYALDRWYLEEATDGAATVQQVSDGPTGFTNSLKVTVTSTDTSIGASQYFEVDQNIEGFNTADLSFGTASASTITISFWVKSSLTGTFGGSIRNSAANRSYPFSYTINAANTWEKETITIAGDTTGTWIGATNGIGLRLTLALAAGSSLSGTVNTWAGANLLAPTGSTNLMGTASATWQVTGVQLEIGTSATPFERRLYNQELANCQRYYYRFNPTSSSSNTLGSGFVQDSTNAQILHFFPVSMRTSPTALEQSGTAGNYAIRSTGGVTTCSTVPTFGDANTNTSQILLIVASGLTGGQAILARAVNTSAWLAWSAEL